MCEQTVKKLFDFIEASPSQFHAIENQKQRLLSEGYTQLFESKAWDLEAGGKYFVTRNGSSIIAFRIPQGEFNGFQIMASHSDAPCFKIKENPEMMSEGHYVKLNVEKYGGLICSTWFDRPLSVAGRLIVKEDGKLVSKLVNVDRDLLMIPNLAIHMNREVNDGYKYSIQKDMLPLFGNEDAKDSFMDIVAAAAGVEKDAILGNDLFLYNRMKGRVWGANNEFFSIGRIDDLQCAFSSLEGFLAAADGASMPVHVVFDNEEVGSQTKQGGAGTFLLDTLLRVCEGLGMSQSQYRQKVAASFMLSADNAHAAHPNYGEKACPTNRPTVNGGVVIKFSANQKYTTDAVSKAVFSEVCSRAEVPTQAYFNHSDVLGGSTLGNISGTQISVNSVDIGVAQLAMHSTYETAGVKDAEYLVKAATEFFASTMEEI